jgi:hypothetical protein
MELRATAMYKYKEYKRDQNKKKKEINWYKYRWEKKKPVWVRQNLRAGKTQWEKDSTRRKATTGRREGEQNDWNS